MCFLSETTNIRYDEKLNSIKSVRTLFAILVFLFRYVYKNEYWIVLSLNTKKKGLSIYFAEKRMR